MNKGIHSGAGKTNRFLKQSGHLKENSKNHAKVFIQLLTLFDVKQ